MTNLDEVMSDSEELSFRLTMQLGAAATVATVSLPCGHAVDLVTRADGARVWLDRFRQRATTPDFPVAVVPFTDEAVSAWHAGTLDPDEYDYVKQLQVMAARMEAAEAAVESVEQLTRGRSAAVRREEVKKSAVRRERDALIRRVKERTTMSATDIADALNLHHVTVWRVLQRPPGV